jgi:NADP-dependent 3-hydroxy acid dehydrogenase YdfG
MAEGRVVAIAGASSGIGRETALFLAKNGYRVAICARRKDLLNEIAEIIHGEGGEVLAIKADMTLWEEAQNFIQSTQLEFGRIDVLFNNAGAGIRFSDFDDLTIKEINDGIAINLTTVLYGCKAVLPYMKKQKEGHIINTTSILGKRARAGLAVYTAAKHGVHGFSRALFNEVKKYGVRVTILGPAMINTEWAEKTGIKLPFSKGKMLEKQDIAQVILQVIRTPAHFTLWNIDLMALDQTIDPL